MNEGKEKPRNYSLLGEHGEDLNAKAIIDQSTRQKDEDLQEEENEIQSKEKCLRAKLLMS